MLRRAVSRVTFAAVRRPASQRAALSHVHMATFSAAVPMQTRSAHTSPKNKKKKEQSLVALLSREVEEEKGNCLEADDLRVLQDKIAKDFEITETPGVMDVVLQGKVNGSTVRLQFDSQDVLDMLEGFDETDESEEGSRRAVSPDEEENNGDYEGEHSDEQFANELPGIRVTVDIAKGKHGLQFDCVAGAEMTIERVRFLEDFKAVDGEETVYAGPSFDHLEADLQDAFYKYLAEHKVDDDMAQFITEFADLKEQREYLAFLEQTHKFISK